MLYLISGHVKHLRESLYEKACADANYHGEMVAKFHWFPHSEDIDRVKSIYGKVAAHYAHEKTSTIVTNDENIFNGIRVALVQRKAKIEDITFVYVDDNHKLITVPFDQDGRCNEWPTDYFGEQSMRDLSEILEATHKHYSL